MWKPSHWGLVSSALIETVVWGDGRRWWAGVCEEVVEAALCVHTYKWGGKFRVKVWNQAARAQYWVCQWKRRWWLMEGSSGTACTRWLQWWDTAFAHTNGGRFSTESSKLSHWDSVINIVNLLSTSLHSSISFLHIIPTPETSTIFPT
jgi:hypothetical protein